MIIIVEIILALIVLGTLGFLYAEKRSKALGTKIASTLVALEEHYTSYVDKHRTLLLLQHGTEHTAHTLNDEQLSKIIEEIFAVIKPDLDTLIAHINAADTGFEANNAIRIPVFRNVASLVESLCGPTGKQHAARLSEKDEQRLYNAAKDAIHADMKERMLNWKLDTM
ncbi:MAG: hypothetical protein RML40_06455 [Bacteroidota bacterium]|nr:hypothetical protein [Candidatus Kapabacteria bacterium]MDW8220157.1 hypothetical protein [Bacteroidota bacterium]